MVPEVLDNSAGLFVLGLLASGGSGFWNSILSYLLKVKDIKGEVLKEQIASRQNVKK